MSRPVDHQAREPAPSRELKVSDHCSSNCIDSDVGQLQARLATRGVAKVFGHQQPNVSRSVSTPLRPRNPVRWCGLEAFEVLKVTELEKSHWLGDGL